MTADGARRNEPWRGAQEHYDQAWIQGLAAGREELGNLLRHVDFQKLPLSLQTNLYVVARKLDPQEGGRR